MIRVVCDFAFLEAFSKLDVKSNIDKDSFLDKYIFVQKLLKKNLYINKDEIFIKQLNKSKGSICNTENEIRDGVIAYILNIQKNNQNEINSDIGLISKIKILPDKLAELKPFDIILIKADKVFCQNVSEKYGILCIGLNQETEIHVNIEMTQINFEATNDLFNRFCEILNSKDEIISSAIVIDQHFFSNKVEYNKINSSITKKENKFLTIHFCDNPKNLQPYQQAKSIEKVTSEIQAKCPSLLDKISLNCINKFDYHDRYLITGTKILIAGNSLSTLNCRSFLSSLPFALYYDNLPRNIKELISKST